MRIVSVAARTIRWPIRSDGAARGRTERAAVVIEVRSDRGVVGLGEAAPLPGLSRDTLDDAERAIAGFAGRAPLDDSPPISSLRSFTPPPIASLRAITPPIASLHESTSAAASFAIETALLDAFAREHAMPLSTMLAWFAHAELQIPSLANGHDQDTVPLAAVVDDPEAACRHFAAGIRCFKIKLAADDDLGRVFAIAAAVPDARLRIDANRSWPRGDVAARLAALARLPIDYVEEPCQDAHRLLDEPLALRLALDESLATIAPADLDRALRNPQLGAVVLKPTLLGGVCPALELAGRARQAGVAAIASHGLEGPIGTAACAELALALGGSYPAGLAAHPALAAWRLDVPQLAPDHLHPATGPGLGFVDLDLSAAVRACTGTPA